MSPRGIRFVQIYMKQKAIAIGLVILAVVIISSPFWLFRDFEDVLQSQNQTEDSLVVVFKGDGRDWYVVVDYFPYVKESYSWGEKWHRIIAVDDTALYVSQYASIAVSFDNNEILIKVRQSPIGYVMHEEFLEKFSGECGEEMLRFCKRYKLPYGKIKEVCCGD